MAKILDLLGFGGGKAYNRFARARLIFSLFMIISIWVELARNPTVVASITRMGIPEYWLTLLGILKIAGLIVLWIPGRYRLKEWAFAGFCFDFIGAIYAFAFTGHTFTPDMLIAVLALLNGLILYRHYHQLFQVKITTQLD